MKFNVGTPQLLACLLALLWSIRAEAAEIRLKADYMSQESVVTLGQVADIAGDSAEAEQLGEIVLFPAPYPGRDRFVRAAEIHELLRLYGFDPLQHRILGAPVTKVRGAETVGRKQSGKSLLDMSQLNRRTAADSLARPAARSPVKGPDPMSKVIVAARPIAPGEVLQETDLTLLEMPTPRSGAKITDEITDVVGLTAARPIPAEQIIDLRDLKRPSLVRRGEFVTVYSRSAGVVVRTQAKAVEEGTLGGLILVESPQNRQRYSARISGPQQVEVFASGATIARDTTYTRVAKTPTQPATVRVTRRATDAEPFRR